MSRKVFISYRRDDARWQAREIYRALKQVLPSDHVFMDIDSIPIGVDFVKFLEGWVEQCDIMLALIGAGWAEGIDPKTGRRRLDNPDDFVRIEVRKGLSRGIPVVPIMLDGATIPGAGQLPDDLQRLLRHNAEFIDHRTVDTDVERLIRKLGLTDRPAQTDQPVQTAPASPVVAPSGSATVGDQMRADGRIKVDAKFMQGAPSGWFKPGTGKTEWFKDHEAGPEMVVVPAGSFVMGSPEQEEGRFDNEAQVPVTITRPFAVGKFAVTFDQWDAFVADGGAKGYRPDDKGWGRGNRPVIYVSWDDAEAYAEWLSQKTGKTYRLLSEAEREYVTRAGTTTPFWWGSSISTNQANYSGSYAYASGRKGENRDQTVPVDSFEANAWGLFNVHGNVLEWTEDCWNESNQGNPGNGSARATGDCSQRVARGGAWYGLPDSTRAARRFGYSTNSREFHLGFRLARTLNP